MNASPYVSVVVTLYNKALYIERAIRSVLSQSYQDFEVVVIDDGSTDGGGDIVKKISDQRIRLIRQKNAGEGAARNRGIRESTGTLITMLDGDDEWKSDFLRAVVSLSVKYPEAGICATGYDTTHHRNLTIETTLLPVNGDNQCLIPDYFRKARIAYFVWSSAQAIPRRVYDDIGGFAEKEPMGADLDMWGRIALKYPLAYDSRPLAIYHNEATGRVVMEWGKKPTFPPFMRSARTAIAQGTVQLNVLPDLHEYINRLLLQYVKRVIATGDRTELRRVLYEELYPSNIYSLEVTLLKFASKALPLRLIYLLQRFISSRWVSLINSSRVEKGVVCRIVPTPKHRT